MAALSHFCKYNVCKRYRVDGVYYYSLTGKDYRTATVEWRRKEVKPRRKRGAVVYLAHSTGTKQPLQDTVERLERQVAELAVQITKLTNAQGVQ
jgi:hypothetical protein